MDIHRCCAHAPLSIELHIHVIVDPTDLPKVRPSESCSQSDLPIPVRAADPAAGIPAAPCRGGAVPMDSITHWRSEGNSESVHSTSEAPVPMSLEDHEHSVSLTWSFPIATRSQTPVIIPSSLSSALLTKSCTWLFTTSVVFKSSPVRFRASE